ncbi:MAG: sel1 repeat family protein [Magnetococcales bacterium]|nr:sel1 repeat family protein [Magnetococcales bacterium]
MRKRAMILPTPTAMGIALLVCCLAASSLSAAGQEAELLRRAQAGEVKAQTRLGQLGFDRGDYQAAMFWFRQAAAQGDPTAQNGVGTLYDNGKGVGRDYREAAQWFLLAANQGHVMARRNLGWMHEKGQGFRKDPVLAYQWFLLAEMSRTRSPDPPCRLCDGVARHMTREEIGKARELARNWQPTPR